MASRFFGARSAGKQHLLHRGLGAEVSDLRNDVEAAFQQQEDEASRTRSTRPATPFVGQSYFDTELSSSFVWTGSMWVPCVANPSWFIIISPQMCQAAAPGGTSVTFTSSPRPPGTFVEGYLVGGDPYTAAYPGGIGLYISLEYSGGQLAVVDDNANVRLSAPIQISTSTELGSFAVTLSIAHGTFADLQPLGGGDSLSIIFLTSLHTFIP